MSKKKEKKTKTLGGLKKALYKGRTTKFKSYIAVMICFGILFSGLYFVKFAYDEYAASRAEIVLTFPQIAQSKNPDSSRFTYFDFVSDENLEKALNILKEQGKYEHFTVDDIRDKFYIYSNLESSAGASVSVARSEGNDFSYVANEYKITFIQPHDYKSFNPLDWFVAPDYSKDFLNALMEVNRERLAEELGGINSFKELTRIEDVANYDYSEEVGFYSTKINGIISYLKYLDKKKADFVSKKHNLKIDDLESRYEFLITNDLNGIADFVESSGISKDLENMQNKLSVNIENNTLKYNKALDRAQINGYAMSNYDQTFTENLINVVQNEQYGLYQARPKTAFDTVTVEKHHADEETAEYDAVIKKYNNELYIYNTVAQSPEEYERLTNKTNELMNGFKAKYDELSVIACEVVTEFYNSYNEDYITYKVKTRDLISKSLIIKLGIVFCLGACFAFIMSVFTTSFKDSRKLRRKKKLIKSIKQNSKKKGA